MPIGIVTDTDFQREMDSLSGSMKPVSTVPSIPITQVVDLPSRGRKEGDVNVPESLRKIIGETSVIDGRKSALQIAADFGISPSSVSAYARGATSTKTYDTPNKEILKHINKSRERTIKRSSRVLNSALKAITQDKLDYTDARDLSGIAKDMSTIIKNLEPPPNSNESDPSIQQPQFVIFAPSFRQENSYEFIKVDE